ncbi:MAG: tetraacyldisaccharide 4'-kinase [Desulfobacteraceae bacterium]|nr:tetraacyldisaccharide 4'-kinase [Desulfobacteraceae bacterium]
MSRRALFTRFLRPARNRVERLMREPRAPQSASAALFHFASRIYGRAVLFRCDGYASGRFATRTLPCFVISVGNLTVGGTGKTPMTTYLARTLQHLGYRPAVVSRGYGGRRRHGTAVAGDGRRPLLTADQVGDEPCMMANSLTGIPVVVGRNRYDAGLLALRTFAVNILVLDDAFQHLSLERDLDIVMLNQQRPLGNGHLLPRGTLREPATGLRRADAVVFTRDGSESRRSVGALLSENTARFDARRHPEVYERVCHGAARNPMTLPNGLLPRPTSWLSGRRVAAFSGIADNKRFSDSLLSLGCEILSFRGFPDHHRYETEELHGIAATASAVSADLVVTTEKDYARIAHRVPWTAHTAVVGIRLHLADEQRFHEFLTASIARKALPSRGHCARKGA